MDEVSKMWRRRWTEGLWKNGQNVTFVKNAAHKRLWKIDKAQ